MNKPQSGIKILFPGGTDEVAQALMRQRGGVSVEVCADDGSRYELCFVTLKHLQESLAAMQERDIPCLAEPNMFIVPQVTIEGVEKSVEFLWREGFLRRYAAPYRPSLKQVVNTAMKFVLFRSGK